VLDQLTSVDFIPCLHQAFTIRIESAEPIKLELASVTNLAAAGERANQAQRLFSLLFLGPVSQHYLLQHTYRIEHEQLGALDLFLVPVGPEGGRMRYEAIFN